jgi:C-terminal processing protease CtpA/Prc
MIALIARVTDTHANLWSSIDVRPPRGKAQVPVSVRFIENRAVVTGYQHETLGPASGLLVGDVIRAIDGVPVDALVKRWRPMYAASNEPTRLRDMARSLTKGEPGPVRLTVTRGGRTLDLSATRVPADSLNLKSGQTHDLPGPTFRRLSQDVAYIKLSSVKSGEVDEYVRGAMGARCLIFDMRNYPSAFMVFDLIPHFVRDSTAFVCFTTGDPSNPGAFDFAPPLRVPPAKPYFEGGVAILVDEVTQSSAEYHAMAMRSRPGAIVVGSTTAGADGNVSTIPLPGGLRTMISGIGVFYPDHRPTQRVGIVPDVVVRPTIAGVRAGRDEVLEAAIQRVLGRPVTAAERAAMMSPTP